MLHGVYAAHRIELSIKNKDVPYEHASKVYLE